MSTNTQISKSCNIEEIFKSRKRYHEYLTKRRAILDQLEEESKEIIADLENAFCGRRNNEKDLLHEEKKYGYSFSGDAIPTTAQSLLVYAQNRFDVRDLSEDEKTAKVLDRYIWQGLYNATGFMEILDAERKSQLRTDLSELKFPELTTSNVISTFSDILNRKEDIFAESIVNIFKRQSYDYKSHSVKKLNKKIIISWACDSYCGIGWKTKEYLDDVEKLLRKLDGLPELPPSQQISALCQDERKKGETQAKGKYFTVKWFKNGNVHLIFHNENLVKKLNKIIGSYYKNQIGTGR